MRCLAYSPPGGLLSTEAATESEKFTRSLVLGDDVIPRTSLANIARLSRDIKGTATRDLILLFLFALYWSGFSIMNPYRYRGVFEA